MKNSNRLDLDAMITEATIDCHDESECASGFYTMLEDNLAVPFQTVVLGVEVTVTEVELSDDERLSAVCTSGGAKQRIPILDLPLPTPPPDGSEWIEAYRHWLRGTW